MKLIPIALLLVLAVAVSAQIGPEKSHHFQDGECNRNNDNCNWIIGHWTGHVTSSSTSLRFFDLPDRDFPLVNTPWAQEFDDLYCTDRHYDIPYSCTFGYSEEDDNLYQYCWFEAVTVEICPANYGYVRADNNDDSTFFAQSFATPAFFMTNRISSLENGISYRNLETNVEGCLPYDVASKDLFIGNLYDGFSSIGQCSPSSDDFGPSPVVPASCQPYFAPTTTPSTTSTTTLSTTSTTTPSTTSTTTPSTTSTTSTTTTSTSTTSTTTTTPTTTTSTTTTTTSGTTTTSTNPAADYGCSQIYDGQDAVYVFELSRVRPASFPYEHIDYSNSRCTGSDHHDCVCDRQSSSCNWLVGTWNGFLYAKGYNSFDFINFVDQPDYPFPEDEDDVRCQWGETATPFHCVYYFNEETDYLNSHCWYEETSGLVTYGSPYTTFAWEQWTEISSLNTGLVSAQSSADFLTDGECILFDRFDSDTFIAQFPDGFSDYQSCGEGTNISPDTVFQCVDGSVSGNIGDNLMFTLNYREQDATWHDWDVSSSLSPLIALSIVLAALLALF